MHGWALELDFCCMVDSEEEEVQNRGEQRRVKEAIEKRQRDDEKREKRRRLLLHARSSSTCPYSIPSMLTQSSLGFHIHQHPARTRFLYEPAPPENAMLTASGAREGEGVAEA